MGLFEQQGYAKTTVEQIAHAADVSHTTFFRYFQSKEQVVIGDDLDDSRAAAIAAIPPGLGHFDFLRTLVTALWGVSMADPWTSNVARMTLIRTEPVLRVAHQVEADRAISEATGFFADYLGVDAADPRLRVFIAASAGVMVHLTADAENLTDGRVLADLIDAIDLLERGLPL